MTDRCEIPGCGNHEAITYLCHGVCAEHYDTLTKNELERALGIGRGPTIGCIPTVDVPTAGLEAVGVTTTPAKENPMSSKTKKAEKATTEKTAKKTREPKEKMQLRTLALRVSDADFDLIHKAAGPRGLSKFMYEAITKAAAKA